MPGLGFRPLRYQDGTGPEGVEKPGMTHENALLYIKWLHGEGSGNLPPSERMSLNFLAEAMGIWQDNPEAAIEYATRLQTLIEAAPDVGPSSIEGLTSPSDMMGLYSQEYINPFTTESPGNLERHTEIIPRGQMASPPVTLPPGEGIDLRQPMGYAHGGYASRGTVAGELPRYGNMSVREEGETMGELSKRHRDQDWYSRMSGGLGSLGPRRRVA